MIIHNLNFAIMNKNKRQLGTVTVTKKGELKMTPNVGKSLTDEELVNISRRALDAFSLLTTGVVDKNMFHFSIAKGSDRNPITYYYMENRTYVGHILHKNHHLNFDKNVPSYMRLLCMRELDEKKVRYYYNGSYHNY